MYRTDIRDLFSTYGGGVLHGKNMTFPKTASKHSRRPSRRSWPWDRTHTEIWLKDTSLGTRRPHMGKQHHFSSSTVNKNSNPTTNSARRPFYKSQFAETVPSTGAAVLAQTARLGKNAKFAKGLTQNQNADVLELPQNTTHPIVPRNQRRLLKTKPTPIKIN